MARYSPIFFSRLILLLSLATIGNASATTQLNFALLVFNGEQRNAYTRQVKAFEKENPSIRVNIQALESEQYKQRIESWLSASQHSDVVFWFGGERLNWYIQRGWVLPINELWLSGDWYNRITQSAQSSVLRNGNMYGLPIHYYSWGIYYKKSVFEKVGIDVPSDWKAFVSACTTLRDNGITPIALGSSEAWPLAGWFDYLNLRINGLDFHQQLTSGNVSYHDARVKAVFKYWEELIAKGCFMAGHERRTWRQALPYLYRDMAGMFLMGNFWTSQIPKSYREQFSMFRFPVIDSDVPLFEEAPTDVLFIPSNAVNVEAAKKFLRYMARPSVQDELNSELGMLAPQSLQENNTDHFLTLGKRILDSAEGASQFFDRDNPQPIAIDGMTQMQKFVNDPGTLSEVLDELERLREETFNR